MLAIPLSLALALIGPCALAGAQPEPLEPAAPMKISTGTLDADCAWTLLEYELRREIPSSARVRLRALPGGEEVPCQVERTEKGLRIAWVAAALKKGAEAAWLLELYTEEERDRPRKPRVEVQPAGDAAISVRVDGEEFTRLVHDTAQAKPYLYPVRGPHGTSITRHFPMQAGVAGEAQDHPHHRSLWLTHGSVGEVDFWAEGPKAGRIVQTRVESTAGGPVFGRIVTENEWRAPDGKVILKDRRVISVYPLAGGEALLDFSAVLRPAEGGGDVVFGDTKEGTFGIRLAETMKEARGGAIVNSRLERGEKAAWGKPAEWVDYSGPVSAGAGGAEGKPGAGAAESMVVGVAILDHPQSFRHPTHWHVRGYGLFAANPFGYRDFYRDKSNDGTFRLEVGKSMELRYRVYFHKGGPLDARVAEVYRGFAHPPPLRASSP